MEFGIVGILFNLISSEDSLIFIKEEVILLCISLLLGGNPMAQESFYEEMINDRNNDFLISLKELIRQYFENVKKMMKKITAQAQKRMFDRILEKKKTNGSSEDEDIDENLSDKSDYQKFDLDEEENLEITFLIRMFRLLQLFCEGHNFSLQNHLREQTFRGSKTGRYSFIKN